jgi:Raf kinase inhibitor-like YbhB/YbcL family protein
MKEAAMRTNPMAWSPRVLLAAAFSVLVLASAACESRTAVTGEEKAMTFPLTSPAFKNTERIPVPYTGEGADMSPPLEWGDPPAATKSFALICDDPDAPVGTWDHWVLWNLPGEQRKLPENVAKVDTLPDLGGARQGKNSWPKIGYNGPMPPKGHGTHHYNFVLYALDAPLDLKAGADKKALLAAMKGHVLGQARLTGTYSR